MLTMSRRKQLKPRALKRELEDGAEDPDNSVTMATDAGRDVPGGATRLDVAVDGDSSIAEDSLGPDDAVSNADISVDDKDVDVDVDGTAEPEEEEEERYRCETCNNLFHSLSDFMDHRNYDCIADSENVWLHRISPSLSRSSSSPYSSIDDACKSPDSPGSPTTMALPPEEMPFTVGIDEGHPYACQYCEKAFARISHLKRHEQVHPDLLPYKCIFCHRVFKHKRSRDRHVKLHTGDRKFKCELCDSAFARTNSFYLTYIQKSTRKLDAEHQRSDHLKIHMKSHDVSAVKPYSETSAVKPYLCMVCNQAYSSVDALALHLQTHGIMPPLNEQTDGQMDIKTFSCPTCGMMFSDLTELQAHLLVHEEAKDKAVQCPYCRELCMGKEAMEFHFQQNHIGEKFRCPICNAAYPNIDDLFNHLKTQHDYDSAGSPVPISIAPTGRSQNSALLRALESGVKFDCPYCDKGGFSSIDVLEIHVHTLHSSKLGQPNLCQICNSIYTSPELLEQHMKTQHGSGMNSLGVSYPCDSCTLQFTSADALNAHKETHKYRAAEGKISDNVMCSICAHVLPSVLALSEHMSTVHGLSLSANPHPSASSPSTSSSPLSGVNKIDRSVKSAEKRKSIDEQRVIKVESASSNSSSAPSPKRIKTENGTSESLFCEQCNATFIEVNAYEAHMKGHADGNMGSYTCPECGASFATDDLLENHILVHYLVLTTEYGCTSCLKLFSKPDELQKHLMDIHAHHMYRCTLCREVFDSKVNVQVHFSVKHSNECKLYKCLPCGSIFRSEMEWQLHVKVHHLAMSKPYRCLFCKDSFGSEVDLQCHLTSHKKAFGCPLCEEAFHVEYLLDKHMQAKHNPTDDAAKTPKTSQPENEALDFSMSSINGSGKSSAQISPVSQSSSHTPAPPTPTISPIQVTSPVTSIPTNIMPVMKKGELNYKCDICDVKFSEETTLHKHRMQDHSISPEMNSMLQKAQQAAQAATENKIHAPGPDKFSQLCVYCNSTFKTKGELEKHMKTHVTPSNQKCNICDEIYPSPSILAEHKLTHCKVVKGNVCVVCKVGMKSEEQFYSHAQQHGFTGTSMQCIVCRQTLSSMLELQMHGKHHFQGNPSFYTCCVCLSSFESKDKLISKLNTSGRSYYVCKTCYQGETNDYRCNTCNVKFESQSQLDVHSAQHKKTYQCIKCQQAFATEYEIQLHVATHMMQEGNVHICHICNSSFDSPAKLQSHLIEHTFGGEEMRCYVCSSLFTQASNIQIHVLEHGIGARKFSCTHCHQKFFFSAELENHLYSHAARHLVATSNMAATPLIASSATIMAPLPKTPVEFHCPVCAKSYTSLSSLNAHVKNHEKAVNEVMLRCPNCSNTYMTMADLQQHILQQHSSSEGMPMPEKAAPSKPFQCSECRKEFSSLSSLHMHMRVHASGKENSRVHLKSLKPPKPVPCPICGKTFAAKANVKEHMKIHFVQSSIFACDLCSETFSQAKQLRRHTLAAHPSPSDQVCPVCQVVFSGTKQLRQHLLDQHAIEEPLPPHENNNTSTNTNTITNAPNTSDTSSSGDDHENSSNHSNSLSNTHHENTNHKDSVSDMKESLLGKSTSKMEVEMPPLSVNGKPLDGVTVVANPSEQVTVS